MSVYLPVQAIAFELIKLEILLLAHGYILTISMSSLRIKVIAPRSNEKLTVTSVYLYATKTYLKGRGHFKVRVTQYQSRMKGNKFSVHLQMFL